MIEILLLRLFETIELFSFIGSNKKFKQKIIIIFLK